MNLMSKIAECFQNFFLSIVDDNNIAQKADPETTKACFIEIMESCRDAQVLSHGLEGGALSAENDRLPSNLYNIDPSLQFKNAANESLNTSTHAQSRVLQMAFDGYDQKMAENTLQTQNDYNASTLKMSV